MIVDLLGEGSPENPVFLKLYDRRFAEQLRGDHGIDPWTMDAEKEYINAVRTGAGKLVPRLVARVHLARSLPDAGIGNTDAAEAKLLHIKGILLQYIDCFSLSKMQDHAPKSEWQGIVDQAVAIVQAIGDHGILNRDVRPDNFIVWRDRSGCYRVFMIYFGLARLRGRNESDRDWAKAKLTKDEEGAVGGDEEAAWQRRL
ncbi:hypothetical protein GE09DRAFT_1288817 [Coniochaeta sp. 2T2.1]|nr:hypothetical protein GE09DRAFT_1288817 [Coniochaeta sp. 2T2.1]